MKKQLTEKSDVVRLNFDLPKNVRNAFKAKAASEGLTVKEVLTQLVKNYLKDANDKTRT